MLCSLRKKNSDKNKNKNEFITITETMMEIIHYYKKT